MTNILDEKSLATLGQSALEKFRAAYIKLENNESTIPGQPDAAMLKQEMQRFQLWAVNLGLYRHDHGSLDYRLRDNEVVKSFTRDLLINLDESLEEIDDIFKANDQNSSSMPSEMPSPNAVIEANDESSSTSSDREHAASLITMGTLNDADDENESMLILHLEDVTEAINQMYKLAAQIRSPKSRNVRTDIDLYKEVASDIKSEYIQMRKRAELQGIEQILLQSRKSLIESHNQKEEIVLTPEDHGLIKRLQKANHTRRQQFEYWRRSKTRSIQAAFKAVETLPDTRSQDRRLANVFAHETPPLAQHSEVTPSVLSSVPALPKDFVLRDSKSTYSGTSRGLTVHGPSGEKVDWPKPPVPSPLKGDFECPFCFYLCTPRHYEDATWRSHLKHDLRPYVCTYDQCPEPNMLYDSWEEWTRHEQWTHQQRIWRCLEHPQHEFVHLAAYEGHVRIYHAESVHQMLSSELLKFQESVSQECDRPCPFCHGDFERPHDMQQHLAGHLEAIALLSLPNLDDIDNNSEAGKVETNEANRNYAESRANDFDRTIPLVFRDNDESEAIPLATKTDSELFEFSLNAKSVSFDRKNETTIEAHEDYSKEIVGKWLSELQYQHVSLIRPATEQPATQEPYHGSPNQAGPNYHAPERASNSIVPKSPPVVAPPPPQYPEPSYRAPPAAYRDTRGVLHRGLPPQYVPHLVSGIAAEPPSFQYRRDSSGNLYQVPYIPPTIREPPVPPPQPPIRSPSIREHTHGPHGPPEAAENPFASPNISQPPRGSYPDYGSPPLRARTPPQVPSSRAAIGQYSEYGSITEDRQPVLIRDQTFSGTFESSDSSEPSESYKGGAGSHSTRARRRRSSVHVEGLDESRSSSLGRIESPDYHSARLSRQASIKEKKSLGEEIQSPQLENFPDLPSQEEKSSTHHWLPDVFDQSRSSTLLEDSGQTSVLLGPHRPRCMARLSESYTNLLELPFGHGDFLVRIYYRSHDARSRILCSIVPPPGSQKDSDLPLVSLSVHRSGPLLKLIHVDASGVNLWAALKFRTYERLVLFHCSFLALRSEDRNETVNKILDYELDEEKELFAGRIFDDHYEHALRLFQDEDTSVVRLQASVHTGELERKPIWTAFITDQILSSTWLKREGPRVFHLADLQQYIFSAEYTPPKTLSGQFVLTFVGSADASGFTRALKELVKKMKYKMQH